MQVLHHTRLGHDSVVRTKWVCHPFSYVSQDIPAVNARIRTTRTSASKALTRRRIVFSLWGAVGRQSGGGLSALWFQSAPAFDRAAYDSGSLL